MWRLYEIRNKSWWIIFKYIYKRYLNLEIYSDPDEILKPNARKLLVIKKWSNMNNSMRQSRMHQFNVPNSFITCMSRYIYYTLMYIFSLWISEIIQFWSLNFFKKIVSSNLLFWGKKYIYLKTQNWIHLKF